MLRDRLRELADAGSSLRDLTSELDWHRHTLEPEQYDELWLYCWALQRSKKRRSGSALWNGEQWNYEPLAAG
jgi:hypothetical protein